MAVIDFATRFPDAEALGNVDALSVAEALLNIFHRLRFPHGISDRSAAFLSEAMRCLWRCCRVKHITSTTFHPQTNELVEKFNSSIMLMSGTCVVDYSIFCSITLTFFLLKSEGKCLCILWSECVCIRQRTASPCCFPLLVA